MGDVVGEGMSQMEAGKQETIRHPHEGKRGREVVRRKERAHGMDGRGQVSFASR